MPVSGIREEKQMMGEANKQNRNVLKCTFAHHLLSAMLIEISHSFHFFSSLSADKIRCKNSKQVSQINIFAITD